MPYKKEDIAALRRFLPDNCFDTVLHYLNLYSIQLTITKERKRLLGTYTFNRVAKTHLITVNGNLNRYSFLITLLHEIAHCSTFIAHKGNVLPHGLEWKKDYSKLLQEFSALAIFPDTIVKALAQQIKNPKASCSDIALEKVLNTFDDNSTSIIYISDLSTGTVFSTPQQKVFKLIEKKRTRYLCIEQTSGHKYLFPALYVIDKIIEA